jgi:hypothetical protein
VIDVYKPVVNDAAVANEFFAFSHSHERAGEQLHEYVGERQEVVAQGRVAPQMNVSL